MSSLKTHVKVIDAAQAVIKAIMEEKATLSRKTFSAASKLQQELIIFQLELLNELSEADDMHGEFNEYFSKTGEVIDLPDTGD